MNSLSWFLYLADVLPSMAHGAGFFVLMGVLIVIPGMFVLKFCFTPDRNFTQDQKDKIPFWTISTVLVVTGFLLMLVPERDTIYLIAGSEVGEVVVNSPEAREILNDVKTVIKQQIKDVEEKVK